MGGAAGHMMHPFDNNDLKFKDLKNIITMGLGGTLSREDNVSEKLDGQNLRIIYYGREYSPARGWDISNDIITKTIGRKSIINKLIE